MVRRAFKYRFSPSEQQAQELNRTFGCVRKVYNLALEARTKAWYSEQRRITYVQSSAMLTGWKREPELAFLGEVSSVPLQQTLRHLQGAFTNFWEKLAKYPTFKTKRRSRASAEYTRSAFRYRDGALTLAKMVEPLDIRWSRPLPEGAEPSTVTVSRDSAGRWHVSLLCEVTVQDGPPTDTVIGSGSTQASRPWSPCPAGRRSPTRATSGPTASGSGGRTARTPAAALAPPSPITDRRRDHLHKLTTRLVRENQAVVIEDLQVRKMLGNHCLARAISDAAWRELRGMLEYKCRWYGRDLVVVDRWFPSSKACSACGAVRDGLPLHVREWTCRCGAIHDRDVNAARTIRAAGLAVLACGDGVRPARARAREGRCRRSRNPPG